MNSRNFMFPKPTGRVQIRYWALEYDLRKHRTDYFREEWGILKEKLHLRRDLRLHDLRRTVGLRLTKQMGLRMAQKVLRHKNIATTARAYAPLTMDDMRAALGGID